ncbi:ATP-binding protein [Desulfotalea psychrophila]|uniref:histidine kinase n=1 Tax=Desulfotalea psychrophila (strain LSv54 / DSM 12343) TaxID=177439 RepID=Q6AQ92_DESPS|nr:ATP-binding protein [Desulfotalea psychrophila]CAG35481.1 related to two-component system sensor histidine kinase (Pho family) [Desulfotalea psychrophila LSv54]
MRISLRLKLTLTSLLLLLIPLSGLRFSDMIQEDLLITRKETMLFSARAVASTLTGRSGLFAREQFLSLNPGTDLYLYPLTGPIRINGLQDDWQEQPGSFQLFGKEHLRSATDSSSAFYFRHRSGIWQDYLYAFFEVHDATVVYRPPQSLRLDTSDFLEINTEDANGLSRRYLITTSKPGWVNGFLMAESGAYARRIERRIQGMWRQTADGYAIEIRMPMSLVGRKLAFSVGNVNSSLQPRLEEIIGTAGREERNSLGRAIAPSVEIQKILQELDRPHSRVLIVDSNRKVRATFGHLLDQVRQEEAEADSLLSKASRAIYLVLRPFYHVFMKPFSPALITSQPTSFDSEEIRLALAGKSSVTHYTVEESDVEVMAAIVPLINKGNIIGAVVVEQTTNSILALQNRLIEESISLGILIFSLTSFALLFFASRLSSRIRRLRDQAAAAIGGGGRVQASIRPATTRDEIGDLSRTLAMMLSQIREQNEYREKMADNLEHEMRTPLAAASASLQNLDRELVAPGKRIQNYLDWAILDIARMDNLLTVIRDATSLQDALQRDIKERFDLARALEMWVEHVWQPAFIDVEFHYKKGGNAIFIYGDPTRIHQMCDKIIENAVSFHQKNTPIVIALSCENQQIRLEMSNEGPSLSLEQCRQVFNSMVSLRTQKDEQPHLGLGLFVVRTIVEHHDGQVQVAALEDGREGVCFTIFFPVG